MKKKIFIIEDYERNIKLYKAVFHYVEEVEVKTETDGLKGFEKIKSYNADLILIDYKLPSMNGIEICKKLRKIDIFKEIPIIAVSSSPIEKVTDRASYFEEAGFDFWFSKPINAVKFRKFIMNLLFE